MSDSHSVGRALLTDQEREVLGSGPESADSRDYLYHIRYRIKERYKRLPADITHLMHYYPEIVQKLDAEAEKEGDEQAAAAAELLERLMESAEQMDVVQDMLAELEERERLRECCSFQELRSLAADAGLNPGKNPDREQLVRELVSSGSLEWIDDEPRVENTEQRAAN